MQIRFSRCMILLLAVSALCLAAPTIPGNAKSLDLEAKRIAVTQVDSDWRFHLGDNMAWAQPDFDDSSWPNLHPRVDWTTQGYPRDAEFGWFRFRLLAPAHTENLVFELPAIAKSYQLFYNGKLIGQVGTLPPGPAHNVIGAARVFTFPVNSTSSAKEITVALRLWQDLSIAGTRDSILGGEAYVGAPEAVLHQFSTTKAVNLLSSGGTYTLDIVILIVGAATALLFWFTRERPYLWFGCYLVLETAFFAAELAAEHNAWSFYFYTTSIVLVDMFAGFAFILFLVATVYPGQWKPFLVPALFIVLSELSVVLVLRGVISATAGDIGYFLSNGGAYGLLTWYLIRSWRKGNIYAKLLFFPFAQFLVFTLLNNFVEILLQFNFRSAANFLPGHILLLHEPFEVSLDDVAHVIALLGMLAVLIYRFARTSIEQQRLSSALKAAHEIQQRLVPIDIPNLGGLKTEIAYRAAEEVGGDFCQILPRPDGSIFVAIGDVSGKGLQAAMLGAVAVGALRSIADEKVPPAAALERLNNVLLRTVNSGFVTCLCMVLTADGEVLLANAGHLSPYLDGAELLIESGLPLGIVPGITYNQSTFLLPNASRLTLLSDGVVEARSRTGELFGFERTSKISQLAASEIAAEAHRFGQEDDITVITLDWQTGDVASV